MLLQSSTMTGTIKSVYKRPEGTAGLKITLDDWIHLIVDGGGERGAETVESVPKYYWPGDFVTSGTFAKDTQTLVRVGHVWNSGHVVVNALDDEELLHKLQRVVDNYVKKSGGAVLSEPPVPGQVVLVSNEKGKHTRGVVRSIEGEDCKILLIDFGGIVHATFNKLLHVTSEIASAPIFGLPLTLVDGHGNVIECRELTQELKSYLYDNEFLMEISSVTLNTFRAGSPHPLKATLFRAVKMDDEDVDKVPLNDNIDNEIAHCYTLAVFHIIATNDEEAKKQLESEIAQYMLDANPLGKLPVVDQILLAPYDSVHCRARILNVNELEENCMVMFIDYGDVRVVNFSELFELSPNIMRYDVYGMVVCLDGVSLAEEIYYSIDNASMLDKLEKLFDGTIRMKIVRGSMQDDYMEPGLRGNVTPVLLYNIDYNIGLSSAINLALHNPK